MPLSIKTIIKQQINPEFISEFATKHNELEASVKKATNEIIPIVLLHILKSSEINVFLKQTEENEKLTETVFGQWVYNINNYIANFSGLNNSSAHNLLKNITIISIETIKQQIDTKEDKQKFIDEQKRLLTNELSSEIPLEKLGLVENNSNSDIQYSSQKHSSTNISINNIMKWGIPFILLCYGGYIAYQSIQKIQTEEDKKTKQDSISLKRNLYIIDIPLKDTVITGNKDGFEEKVINFITNKDSLTSQESHIFTMDRVKFDRTGEKTITASSSVQIKNLAIILKKYPKVNIEIHAYNNDIDNWQKNTELSDKRAKYIQKELQKLGINTQILASIGFGNTKSIADKRATDEEKINERKIEILVQKPIKLSDEK